MDYKIVGISVAKSSTLYPQRDGGKSVACVTAAVPVGPVTLDITVYGRMDVKGELSFDVSLPRKGVGIDPATEAGIKAAARASIAAWSGWESAGERAHSLLTAVPGSKADPNAGPALTFTPKTAPAVKVAPAGK